MSTTNSTVKDEANQLKSFRRSMISLGIVYPIIHYTMIIIDPNLSLPIAAVFITPIVYFGLLGLVYQVKSLRKYMTTIKLAVFYVQMFFLSYILYTNDFARSVSFNYWVYILMTANVVENRRSLITYLGVNLALTLSLLLFTGIQAEVPNYLWAFWYSLIFFFVFIAIDSKNGRQRKVLETQIQLEEHQKEIDDLMDSLSAMIYYKDTNNRITRMNKAMGEFMGKDPEFFVGMSLYDIIPRGRAHTYHEEDLKIIQSGQPMNSIIEEVITPLGEKRWLRSDKKPYRDRNGNIKGVVIFSIDITEEREVERRLRQKEQLFTRIFDEAPYGVMIMDLGMKILHANSMLCDQLGYSENEITTLSLLEITADADKEFVEELYKNFNPNDHFATEEVRIQKNSAEFLNTNLVATEIRDENDVPIFYLAMLENITEKRAAEAKLEVYSKNLEESNKDLEQFAYIISHDLKEPLRMITSYTQLLKRRYSKHFDDSAHEFMEYVVDGAKRMNNLINDLLSYSRVGRDKASRQFVEIDEILVMVINNLRLQIQESKADIIMDDDFPEVHCNRPQILTLFQNIISNALKYRRPDVSTVIEIKVEQLDDSWQFSVKDNGIGMEEHHLETIFLIFQRLHNKDEFSGTGIGLAITKRIIQSHNGDIWVTSKVNEGSTFYFTLPIINEADLLEEEY